ncbi:2Fe-2S iron-sulfur cluster-binding protein [Noviherbaspirillum sp.]|uniref:2Fe-2S iron-sulfur cluster-binding protein n=1 Tax=Noviherbaspirillum sp. TaxID=1926288 RepID=UPI002FE2B0FD
MTTELPSPLPADDTPFHQAELAIQERLGVRAKLHQGARAGIRNYMPDQHRTFFAQLPFLLTGAVDEDGQPWASMLVGRPGFIASPDATQLRIDARPLAGDPLSGALRTGSHVGLLGIEPPTRRRNRMNGVVTASDDHGLTVHVQQSFGNCPQYIQSRDFRFIADPASPACSATVLRSAALDDADRALIRSADTFYIATANMRADAGRAKGADVSHRGGRPGFVRIDDARTLTTPDFLGNYFFNTIGNLQVEPRAGLLFIDFDGGDLLYIACEAEIIWEGPEVAAFAGAERLVRFHLREVIRVRDSLPLRWSGIAYSPMLNGTGTWEQAAQTLAAEASRNEWRRFRVRQVQEESVTIRSFILEPDDGGGVLPHLPGQFLPVRLPGTDDAAPLQRTYTLSDASNGRTYRLSVKRDGRASAWLHDHAQSGTIIEALAPRGTFVFNAAARRPAVLLSAGVGITPMIAMVNALFVNDMRTRFPQPVYVIHSARNGREHAFGDLLRRKAQAHANLSLHVTYSHPDESDALGITHDSVGRIGIDLLKRLLPFADADFYLCGPVSFMQSLHDDLRALQVPDAQIHLEQFGGAHPVIRRRTHAGVHKNDQTQPGVPVVFAKSGKSVHWHPGDGSLLELAETHGLAPLSGCRSGACGSCAARLVSGSVAYTTVPGIVCDTHHALLCVTTPESPTSTADPTGHGLVIDI